MSNEGSPDQPSKPARRRRPAGVKPGAETPEEWLERVKREHGPPPPHIVETVRRFNLRAAERIGHEEEGKAAEEAATETDN